MTATLFGGLLVPSFIRYFLAPVIVEGTSVLALDMLRAVWWHLGFLGQDDDGAHSGPQVKECKSRTAGQIQIRGTVI